MVSIKFYVLFYYAYYVNVIIHIYNSKQSEIIHTYVIWYKHFVINGIYVVINERIERWIMRRSIFTRKFNYIVGFNAKYKHEYWKMNFYCKHSYEKDNELFELITWMLYNKDFFISLLCNHLTIKIFKGLPDVNGKLWGYIRSFVLVKGGWYLKKNTSYRWIQKCVLICVCEQVYETLL